MGLELPVFDLGVFQRTAAFLTPETADYLRIFAVGETLERDLRADPLLLNYDALAETAHTLSGSAGMFGFERVTTLARRFERAIQSGAADGPVLADALRAADRGDATGNSGAYPGRHGNCAGAWRRRANERF